MFFNTLLPFMLYVGFQIFCKETALVAAGTTSTMVQCQQLHLLVRIVPWRKKPNVMCTNFCCVPTVNGIMFCVIF